MFSRRKGRLSKRRKMWLLLAPLGLSTRLTGSDVLQTYHNKRWHLMVKATLGKKKIQICGNQEKRIQYIWSYLLNAFSTLVILSGGGG